MMLANLCTISRKKNNTFCHVTAMAILNLTVLLNVQSNVSVKTARFVTGLSASAIISPKNLMSSSLSFQIHLILYLT
eukprot:6468953-Ditylum_brightwellii.AAC.1